MKSLNIIFTGRYLIVWYALFILMVLFMILDYMRLSAVREYKYTVYDKSGQPVSTEVINVQEGRAMMRYMPGSSPVPVEKSFEPVKRWRDIVSPERQAYQ